MISTYQINGRFFEACDCFELCPCWVDDTPDEGHCMGLVAWEIAAGHIDEVDVSGYRVVAVTGHSGSRRASESESLTILFVDSGASEDAFSKLGEAFAGRVPGALGHLAAVTGTVLAPPVHEAITIDDQAGAGRWCIRVGCNDASAAVLATGRALYLDSPQEPLSVNHTALHQELQIHGQATAQRGERLSLAVPALPGGYIEAEGRSGMMGNSPTPTSR